MRASSATNQVMAAMQKNSCYLKIDNLSVYFLQAMILFIVVELDCLRVGTLILSLSPWMHSVASQTSNRWGSKERSSSNLVSIVLKLVQV